MWWCSLYPRLKLLLSCLPVCCAYIDGFSKILEATSDLVPLVVTMGGDSSMQRELDRAVARVINTTSFKREIGGSFGVALATFSDQLLRGRSYRSGQEVNFEMR